MNGQFKYEHLPTISNLPLRQKMVVLTGAGISAESGWLHSEIIMVIGNDAKGNPIK